MDCIVQGVTKSWTWLIDFHFSGNWVLTAFPFPNLSSFSFLFLNWSIVDLQCCVSFRSTTKWCVYEYICIWILFPYRLLQDTEYISSYYKVGLCYLFYISNVYILIPNWWLDDITDSMDMSLSKLREMVEDSEAWHAAMGLQKSQTQLSNWTTATIYPNLSFPLWSPQFVFYVCESISAL